MNTANTAIEGRERDCASLQLGDARILELPDLERAWADAEPVLRAVCERVGLFGVDDLYARLLLGEMFLWRAGDAWAVSHLVSYPQCRVAVVDMLHDDEPERLPRWLHAFQTWARACDASVLAFTDPPRIDAPPGWETSATWVCDVAPAAVVSESVN